MVDEFVLSFFICSAFVSTKCPRDRGHVNGNPAQDWNLPKNGLVWHLVGTADDTHSLLALVFPKRLDLELVLLSGRADALWGEDLASDCADQFVIRHGAKAIEFSIQNRLGFFFIHLL
jgi:hypothetical protein